MRLVFGALIVLLLALPASADFKMVVRTTFEGKNNTETRLVQGDRQRVEVSQSEVHLYQCDKQQLARLNPATRLYTITPIGADGNPVWTLVRVSDDMLYPFTVVTEELKERATIFGYPAWRVRDTITNEERQTKTVVDTWYIDLPILWGCRKPGLPPPLDWTFAGLKITQHGSARRGFPVLTRRVWHGQVWEKSRFQPRTWEHVTQVMELTTLNLDRNLFEIPPGYGKGLDGSLTVPDTFAARTRKAWDRMWLGLAKAIF